MNSKQTDGVRSILRRWGWDVSANAAGTLLATAILALAVAAVSFIHPLNEWLFGLVAMRGWAVAGAILIAALVGFLGGRYRSRNASRTSGSTTAVAVPADVPGPFLPNKLQRGILRLLRFADGKWLQFSLLARELAVDSLQDLRQELRQLEALGWVEGNPDNYGLNENARSYRLADAGILFARASGYKTVTEVQRAEREAE